MRLRCLMIGVALIGSVVLPAAALTRVRRGPTAQRAARGHAPKREVRAASLTNTGMSTERATELQTALIKAGYMEGAPSGSWDAPSQAAMEKLQGDNGWQTKLVPDSRAIIKLGLGPKAPQSGTGTPETEGMGSSSVASQNAHLATQ
jgi:hypothetical protein